MTTRDYPYNLSGAEHTDAELSESADETEAMLEWQYAQMRADKGLISLVGCRGLGAVSMTGSVIGGLPQFGAGSGVEAREWILAVADRYVAASVDRRRSSQSRA